MPTRNMLRHESRTGTNRSAASAPQGRRITAETSLSDIERSRVANKATIALEGSFDGGRTFRTLVASTWVGGQVDRNGDPVGPTIGTQIHGTQPDEIRVMLSTRDTFAVGVDIIETAARAA